MGRIRILQQAMIRRDEVAIACRRGNTRTEAGPLRREEGGHAPIEPVDLGAPGGGDAAEDHCSDALWVSLGVRQPRCFSVFVFFSLGILHGHTI